MDEEAEAWAVKQFASTGAVLMGRAMLDVGIGPWDENPTFHAPVFVVTHRPFAPIVKAGGTSYTFVSEGPDAALRLARAAAGGNDICVAGGAAIVRHYLLAGVIHELRLHLVPVLLGSGTRLFTGIEDRRIEITAAGSVDADGVTHLRCQVQAKAASRA